MTSMSGMETGVGTPHDSNMRVMMGSPLPFGIMIGRADHHVNGLFENQQLIIQGDVPIVQSLNGPQLKRSYMLHAAWQWGF